MCMLCTDCFTPPPDVQYLIVVGGFARDCDWLELYQLSATVLGRSAMSFLTKFGQTDMSLDHDDVAQLNMDKLI